MVKRTITPITNGILINLLDTFFELDLCLKNSLVKAVKPKEAKTITYDIHGRETSVLIDDYEEANGSGDIEKYKKKPYCGDCFQRNFNKKNKNNIKCIHWCPQSIFIDDYKKVEYF